MKTIHQWILEIPNPRIRTKALGNMFAYGLFHPLTPVPSLRDALLRGFVHDWTDEGAHYWINMCHLLDGITPLR